MSIKTGNIENGAKKLYVFFILFMCVSAYAQDYVQEKTHSVFFNGFYASLNRTDFSDANTNNRFGFAIGASRVGYWSENISGVFTVEYNLVRFFKKDASEINHWGNTFTNVKYTLQAITVPLSIRLYANKRNRLFIEPGTTVDLIVNGKAKGMYREHSSTIMKEYTLTQKFDGAAIGLFAAVGTNIPVKKNTLFIKAEYRARIGRDTFNKYITIVVGLKI